MIMVEDVHKRYTTRRGVGDWVLRGVEYTITDTEAKTTADNHREVVPKS